MPAIPLRITRTWDGAAAPADEHVTVTVTDSPDGLRVAVEAPAHGDPPPCTPEGGPAPVGATWALWDHEVVELFVLGADDHYTELELGPHGHHLLLRLHGRRNLVERLLPVDATWRTAGGRWQAEAVLPVGVLPPRPWRVNAYAIHGTGAARRYLAWAPVPGPQPDFHRLEHFLPLPTGEAEA
jgi:hypothetical protein